jgi:DNA-binding LacI/PurR family transcriptional regulator
MPITLKDVAERAGVSRAAVSRTYTDGASVSAKTRAKVEAAATELGYSPNILARSLTTRRTQMIGLVSNNFHNPAFLQIFDEFTRGLQNEGFRPLLVNLSEERDHSRSVRMLQQYSVDGVILASSHLPESFAQAFVAARVPVVHAFGRVKAHPKVDTVAIDDIRAGRMAAETLIARGYRRIGFVGGPQEASTTQDRMAGFLDAARSAGVTPETSFAGNYGFESGRKAMARVLASGPAEAYFCADDVLSIGALAAFAGAGLVVPRDIGVIGLNDMDMAGWSTINLTTIHQPFEDIVATTIALLKSSFDTPDRAPESRTVPCHVVERGTLRPLPDRTTGT